MNELASTLLQKAVAVNKPANTTVKSLQDYSRRLSVVVEGQVASIIKSQQFNALSNAERGQFIRNELLPVFEQVFGLSEGAAYDILLSELKSAGYVFSPAYADDFKDRVGDLVGLTMDKVVNGDLDAAANILSAGLGTISNSAARTAIYNTMKKVEKNTGKKVTAMRHVHSSGNNTCQYCLEKANIAFSSTAALDDFGGWHDYCRCYITVDW